jgi:hypothetical protein
MPHNHNQTPNSIIIQITCKQVSSNNKFAQCAQERDVTAMDISFRVLFGKYFLVYLDDVTIYSKNIKYHVHHLRKSFSNCRRYDIFINPRKSIFVVDE